MAWSAFGPIPRKYRAEVGGVEYEGRTVESIFSAYLANRRGCGQPLPSDWEEVIWKALARSHPKHIKRIPQKAPPTVSLKSATFFLQFMLKRLKRRDLVPIEVAERRASVCSSCPMRSEVLACSVCKDALKWAGALPSTIPVPEGCLACNCWLPGKVQFPRDMLGSADDHPYWDGCWMRLEESGEQVDAGDG